VPDKESKKIGNKEVLIVFIISGAIIGGIIWNDAGGICVGSLIGALWGIFFTY
jgi:hypothetical protein